MSLVRGFVDDTHFMLEADIGNLQKIKIMLDDFSLAPRLNI